MSNKKKFDKNTVPQDFTLSLVAVDSLPVIFFSASIIRLCKLYGSILFLIGALLVITAGACKVLWKLIVVLRKKNIWPLFIQMRILTPIGFVLMIISLFINKVDITQIINAFTSIPSLIFFIIGILGMCLMGVFGKKLDSSNLKANWIEQLTNAIAQLSILIGLLLL